MLKSLVVTPKRLWATVTISAAFVVLGIILQSHLFQECVQTNDAAYAEQTFKEGIATIAWVRWWCAGEFIDGNGGSITALATVALTISTIALWSATRKSVRVAERSLTELERAYVFLDVVTATELKRVELKLDGEFPIAFRNWGKTPAFIRVITLGLTYHADVPQSMPDNIHTLHYGNGLILGNGENTGSFSFPLKLQKTDFDLAAKGVGGFFLVGVIRYTDIMGANHESGYCWNYGFADGSLKIERRSELNYHT